MRVSSWLKRSRCSTRIRGVKTNHLRRPKRVICSNRISITRRTWISNLISITKVPILPMGSTSAKVVLCCSQPQRSKTPQASAMRTFTSPKALDPLGPTDPSNKILGQQPLWLDLEMQIWIVEEQLLPLPWRTITSSTHADSTYKLIMTRISKWQGGLLEQKAVTWSVSSSSVAKGPITIRSRR